ncbi:MAG: phBC6A51 family helix-turn-helix protein, partial [Fermentimonas sp.]|nr:phBC6A51 family helix-turn-helix protein [Fermentimonas sp.]
MAVQRKRKTIKKVTNSNVFIWTGPRTKAANLISEGIKNYEEIAEEVGVHRKTFWVWRQHPIFQAEVSRLTLSNEKATREGLLRLAYKAIEKKIGSIADDKSTVLEWSKFIADLQGFLKQKVELDANMKHDIHDPSKMTDDEL